MTAGEKAAMHCMHCGKKLPLLRKFNGGEFCSEQHRIAYAKEADRLALRRLIETPASPSRSLKQTPANKSFQEALHARPKNPPVQAWLFPLKLSEACNGDRNLMSSVPELSVMGKDLALGYFRGAKPRARLWLPVSSQSAATPTSELLHIAAVPAAVAEPAPEFQRLVNHPQIRASVEPIDWQQLAEEAEEAVKRIEAAPPSAGLVALQAALESEALPANELVMAHVTHMAEAPMIETAFPQLRFRTSNAISQGAASGAEPSRQLRVRPITRASEPPLAGSTGPMWIAARAGSRTGKLDVAELPSVLTRCPQWPNSQYLKIAVRGIPVAGETPLVTFRRVNGVFRPYVTLTGEPLASVRLAYPTMPRQGSNLPHCGGVEIPLPPSRGVQVRMEIEPPTAEHSQPFLEPPGSVPLAAPLLDPPLSTLRALAVNARNPVDSRRPLQLAREADDYDPQVFAFPAVASLDGAAQPQPGRLFGGPSQAAGRVASPVIREEGWPASIPVEEVKPTLPGGSGYRPIGGTSEVKSKTDSSTVGMATRLYTLPQDRLLPRDSARRPHCETVPFPPKGFIILSSSRLKLRVQESSLRQRFQLALPKLPGFGAAPKWGAGVVMVVAIAGFLFTVAPKASGTIAPTEPSPWASIQQTILKRAAVALTDDFRSGLGDWAGKEGWGKSWSFDNTGFVRTGALALYSPSLDLNDYRFEFLGQIEKKALSWVVRAADLQNYEAVRLELTGGGPVPRASVVRYPVVNGKRGKETRTELPMSVTNDTIYRVAMEVHGEDHVLMVQGQVVDSWSEDRLKRGGIGFFSGAGERARLRWIGVWHQYDALGRLCAYLAPRSGVQ